MFCGFGCCFFKFVFLFVCLLLFVVFGVFFRGWGWGVDGCVGVCTFSFQCNKYEQCIYIYIYISTMNVAVINLCLITVI